MSAVPTTAQTFGTSIRATIVAIRALVSSMHEGRVDGFPAPTCIARSKQYWTPSFEQGRRPESEQSACYNALHLSVLLGNASPSRRPHDIIKIALLLLELHELSEINDQDLEDIYEGTDGFTMKTLDKVLRGTRNDHYLVEAEELLSQA